MAASGLSWSCFDIILLYFVHIYSYFITARKRSLGQGNIFRSMCQELYPQGRGEGVLSQHALQVLSQHALQQVSGGGWYPSMPCRFPGPHPRGKFRGIWPGGVSPGPHPRGKLRGIWSMPTPKGELEGDLARGVLAPGGCLLRGGGDSNP